MAEPAWQFLGDVRRVRVDQCGLNVAHHLWHRNRDLLSGKVDCIDIVPGGLLLLHWIGLPSAIKAPSVLEGCLVSMLHWLWRRVGGD